ncbi:hypothetical protein J6590_003356, partial [Homalodisca vitripennis]
METGSGSDSVGACAIVGRGRHGPVLPQHIDSGTILQQPADCDLLITLTLEVE